MNGINKDNQIKVMNKIKEEAERYLNIYRPTHGHLVLDDQYMKQIKASLEYGLLTRLLSDVESVDVDYLNQLIERLGESITANTEFKLTELSNAISSINNRVSSLDIQAIRDSIAGEIYTRFNSDGIALGLRLKALEDALGNLSNNSNSATKDLQLELVSITDGINSKVSALEQTIVTRTADDILLASKVSQLESLYEDSNKRLLARIREENESRIDGYKALSQQLTSMVAQVNDSTSTIEDVKRTYSNLEQSYSERISTLESSFKQNDVDVQAKLREQSRTLTEANRALAEKVALLEANVDGKIGAKFNEAIETVSTEQEGLARKISELNTSFLSLDGKLEGAIREEIKSVSDANKAQLSKLEELEGKTETTLGRIKSLQESIITPEQVTNIVTDEMVAKYSNAKDKILDTRDTNELPRYYYNNYPNALAKEVKLSAVMGIDGEGELGYLETQTIGTNYREGKVTQVFYSEDGDTYKRVSITEDIWGVWKLQETDESAKEKLRLALLEIEQKIIESEARIETYNKTHSDATKALAESIKQLEADYKEGDRVINSRILTMEQVQSTVDIASANTLQQLSSALNEVKGSIRNLQSTVTNPDGTIAVSEEMIRSLILDEIKIKETKTVNSTPEWYVNNHLGKTRKELKTSKVIGLTQNGDGYLETSVLSGTVSRGSVKQEVVTENGKIYTRQSTGLRTWSNWVESENSLTANARLLRAKEELEQELARVYSEFTDYKETKARDDEAEALRIQGIDTKLENGYGTLRGLIETEERSRLSQDAAINERIDNISSELSGNFATIRSVNETKATLEGTIAKKSDEITSGFDSKLIEERSITNRDIKASADGVTSVLTAKIDEYKQVASSARTAIDDYKEVNDDAVRALGERQNRLTGEYTQAIVEARQELLNKIDDINIGGRNLLKDTGVVGGYSIYRAGRGVFSTHADYVRVDFTVSGNQGVQVKGHYGHTIKRGDYGILSFEYRTNAPNLIYTYVLNSNGDLAIRPSINNLNNTEVWSKAVLPFTAPKDLTNVRALIGSINPPIGTYIEVRKVKLEIGNKVTDWTPAPEDITESISQVRAIATTAKSTIESFEKTLNDSTKSLAETNRNISARFTETETLITQAKGDAVDLAKQGAIDLINGAKTELKKYSDASIAASEKAQSTQNAAFARRDNELTAIISSLPTAADVEAKIGEETEARVRETEALVKQITKGSVKYPNGTGNVNEVSTVLKSIIKATADSSFVDNSSTFKATLHREVDEKMFRDAGNLLTDTINYTSWRSQKHASETITPRLNNGVWELNGSTTKYKEVLLFSKEGDRLESNEASESLVQVNEDSEYILEFEAKGNVEINVLIRLYFFRGTDRRYRNTSTRVPLQTTWTKHKVQVKCPALNANEVRNYISVIFQSVSVGNAEIRKPRLYLDPSVLNAAIKEYKQMNLDMQGNLDAKIGLTVNSQGRVVGWAATDRNNSSEFNIMADSFKISNSSQTRVPFSIDTQGNIVFNGKVQFNNVTNSPSIPTQNDINTWARNQINLQNPILKRINDSIPSDIKITQLAKAEADKKDSAINAVGNRIDSLKVGGRNLILKSDVSYSGYHSGSRPAMTVSNDVAGATTLTLSADIEIEGNPNTTYAIANRAGVSTRLVYTDGSTQWFEIWQSVENYKGRMVRTFNVPNGKTLANINVCYIQTRLQATKVTVSRPKLERGTIATDWTPAPEDYDTSFDDVNKKLSDLDGGLRDLNITISSSFKDGIIEEAEAKAIEKYINILNKEKNELNTAFGTIYKLGITKGSTEERKYVEAKTGYITAHSQLISSINTAIRDGRTTATDKRDVDDKFNTYNTKLNVAKSILSELNASFAEKINTKADEAKQEVIIKANEAKNKAIEAAAIDATSKADAAKDAAIRIVNNLKIPHILTAQGAYNNNNAWMKINSTTGSRTLAYTASEGIVVQILNQTTLNVESVGVYSKTAAGYLDMKNALTAVTNNRIVMIISRTNVPIVNDRNLRDAFRRAGSTDLIYNTLSKRTNTTFALIGRVGVAGSAYESIVDTGSVMFGQFASVSAIWNAGELLPSNQTLIDGGMLVTNSITAEQIAANAITSNEIAADAIQTRHIKAGSINAHKIAAKAINATHLNANSVNAVHIQANSIRAENVADATLTMAKIADSIQSDNYEPGQQGWRLFKDGRLELNNTFGDGSSLELNSEGLIVWYNKAQGKKAVELGIFT
ncbi:hypothetical protein AAX06_06170 [Moraxella bovoculi]|uniref:Tip attachment protein J central straight fiber domain-containing protein n=1 Tax=Moraxella bovoculi TaxID=386891 RepID=A0AAC8PWB5_9GAMM|nr:interleukin-like EMT inducer domain-containing protein [Moraxella bovoculi]AKG07809.1 hypothetical protein AAX06_06170 [Moraxella bovoculi]AKG11513.1 hypothetical protein AAX07_05355 [Moraxella bovoculi]